MLTVLELCAGGGGQALGVAMAGFSHVGLVEYEQAYVDNMKLNRPEWPVIQGDLKEFNARSYKGIDILTGGVPCPPFSVAGKQLGKDDERDLFPSALRIVEETQPRAIMFENVRGFLSPIFTDYRKQLFEKLNSLGYDVEIHLINASNYGVPQLRPRVSIVGFRKDQNILFNFPMTNGVKPRTVGDTLYDLMAENGWKGAKKWAKHANKIAPTIVGGSKKHGGPDLGPTRARQAWAELGVEGKSVASTAPEENFEGMPRLTPRMMARIQGFPDQWTFGENKRKTVACRMIGNAFPPPVAQTIALAIRKALEGEKAWQV